MRWKFSPNNTLKNLSVLAKEWNQSLEDLARFARNEELPFLIQLKSATRPSAWGQALSAGIFVLDTTFVHQRLVSAANPIYIVLYEPEDVEKSKPVQVNFPAEEVDLLECLLIPTTGRDFLYEKLIQQSFNGDWKRYLFSLKSSHDFTPPPQDATPDDPYIDLREVAEAHQVSVDAAVGSLRRAGVGLFVDLRRIPLGPAGDPAVSGILVEADGFQTEVPLPIGLYPLTANAIFNLSEKLEGGQSFVQARISLEISVAKDGQIHTLKIPGDQTNLSIVTEKKELGRAFGPMKKLYCVEAILQKCSLLQPSEKREAKWKWNRTDDDLREYLCEVCDQLQLPKKPTELLKRYETRSGQIKSKMPPERFTYKGLPKEVSDAIGTVLKTDKTR